MLFKCFDFSPSPQKKKRMQAKKLRLKYGSKRSLKFLFYSHSMVDGGFEEISRHTLLTPFTSLIMRFEILASNS